MPTHLLLRRLAAPAIFALVAACESTSTTSPPPPPPPTPPQDPAQVVWLRTNAHPIRSLSVADRDFSDLQPLKAAIGDARVVMLGEQSHGDGATFLAKARLIAFLHQEMGFDVLAWESGLWDVGQVWRQVQAGAQVLPASKRGIFSIWMGSEQVLPTFDYVASTVGTARPLELAGFDNQFTGSLARDSMAILTERFARSIGSTVPDDAEWPAARETLRQLASNLHYATKPTAAEQARLLRLLSALAQDVAARPATDREALFWTQVLEGVQTHARAIWAELPNQSTPEAANARDTQMGRNLVWLANTYYPGRKIIAWAASSHIGRDMGQLRAQDGQQYYQNVWTVHMGGEAYSVLGAQMYAIGFTAGTGSFGRYSMAPTTLQPPLAASLEAYLTQAGKTNAFVNFRNPAAGGEWLRDMWTRPFGYAYMRGDWTRVFDGMIYTAEMTPSTPAG
ncbi:MAG TPA: erythromycin esterase family protein [Longimicrobium sp.]|nr:erythromycin esterase family protein [Longimicrobium sp.]